MRIVVDDDQICREQTQTLVKKLGHESLAFDSAREALAVMEQSSAQVVISDWDMPDMDGLELCRSIRAGKNPRYTYFILTTSVNTSKADYERAMRAAVDDFLLKPITTDALWGRLMVATRIIPFIGEIRQLRQLIPICSNCKKVRDVDDYWQQLEQYFHAQPGSRFSHGICPECYEDWVKKYFPEEASTAKS
jgi:CheY-like chemotaxis protein